MKRMRVPCRRLGLAGATVMAIAAATAALATAAANPPVVHVGRASSYPKVFVVTMRSATMEPTLHCARKSPDNGCLARRSDQLRIRRLHAAPHRGDIVLLVTPRPLCNGAAGEKFIKRVIGVPGDTVEERMLFGKAYTYVNGRLLKEPYVSSADRDSRQLTKTKVPNGQFFLMGDNRMHSCDSRAWGTLDGASLIGTVVKIIRYG